MRVCRKVCLAARALMVQEAEQLPRPAHPHTHLMKERSHSPLRRSLCPPEPAGCEPSLAPEALPVEGWVSGPAATVVVAQSASPLSTPSSATEHSAGPAFAGLHAGRRGPGSGSGLEASAAELASTHCRFHWLPRAGEQQPHLPLSLAESG